jgi:RNA polymerase sigma-70 factor, ECF subfamily
MERRLSRVLALSPVETPLPAMPAISEEGFRLLYRQTAGPLHRYVARVLGNATEADDIVQDAYVCLLRTTSSRPVSPATTDAQQLRPLLFHMASHLIVDHWRRRERERGAVDERALASSAPEADIPLRIDLARTFEALRPQERALMWLAYVEGFDHREIAAALGLRERSVRVLLHRVRHKLAALLGDPS